MKKHGRLILKIATALCAAAALFGAGQMLLFLYLVRKTWSPGEAGSIGIIGGADGPTAIFVTGQVSPLQWMRAGLWAALAAAGCAALWLTRKKK